MGTRPVAPSTKVADVTLVDLVEQFGGDEDTCREYLEMLRWPEGVECPRCENKSVSRIEKRNQYDCNSCRYQFSVKAGTVLNDSHLPLWKWFLAVYLMCESKKGVSANQIKRTLRVSYKTAWYLCHRIRHAMGDDDAEPLSGVVEVDETYIGGKAPRGMKDKLDNKVMVLGAVERGGEVRFRAAGIGERGTRPILHGFIDENVEDADAIYTDQWRGYGDLNDGKRVHETVNHHDKEWVRGNAHTNTIESAWSLLDRGIMGTFHKITHKHLPAYLQEFEFRYNNRENAFIFRDTLLALLEGEHLPYEKLTAQ